MIRNNSYKKRVRKYLEELEEWKKQEPVYGRAWCNWQDAAPSPPYYEDIKNMAQNWTWKEKYEDYGDDVEGVALEISIRTKHLMEVDKIGHIPELIRAYRLLRDICNLHEQIYHGNALVLNNLYYYLLEFSAIPVEKGIYTDTSQVGSRAHLLKGLK